MVARPYKKPYAGSARRREFVPGRDRRVGFYGRYAGRNSELKFHDVDLDDAAVASGSNITATINIIPQDITESGRIGRKCTIKNVMWRFRVTLPEQDAVATPASSDSIRVILYLDKQTNGAAATGADLLEANNVHAFKNLANTGRFVFLLDKVVNINWNSMASDGAGLVSQAESSREFTFFKSCNIPLEFDNTTGAITELRSNNLGVNIVGRQGIATFTSKIRLRYSDM